MARAKKPKVAGVDEIGRVCAYATQQCLMPDGCVQREAGLIAGDATSMELSGFNCSMHGAFLWTREIESGVLKRSTTMVERRAAARADRVVNLLARVKARGEGGDAMT